MLEAMQLTYVTTPTLMARFPGGRKQSFRWVMIPGNEPTGDDRYVGITTVTVQQWQALARLIGRPDQADDDVLGTMIGRFQRADEVNGAIHAYTRAHGADEIVAACVEARVPAAIVGNGAELPRNEQLAARNVFVQQPGEEWIRPRAPFRFHGVADRALAPPRRRVRAPGRRGRRPTTRRRPRRRACGDRPLAGIRVLDFTAFWAGPFATAWLSSMGADVVKVEAVQRPDGIRFSAAVRPHDDPQFYEKSALFHACNLAKRGITLDLGHPDGLALAKRLVARSDVVAENFTPQVMERFGLDWDTVHDVEPGRDHAAHARVRARRPVAIPRRLRADDGAAHRYGVGDRIRRRSADHPGRSGRPDGRRPRRARARRRARATRAHRRRVCSSRCRWSRSRPRSPPNR